MSHYGSKEWPGPEGVKAFAQEYVIDFNPVAAVYRANLRPGRKTAKKIAEELLRLSDVQKEIRKLMDESEKSSLITKSRVESLLWKEANDIMESGSSRVGALTQLCKVKGYNHESERELTLKGKSPVINITLTGEES